MYWHCISCCIRGLDIYYKVEYVTLCDTFVSLNLPYNFFPLSPFPMKSSKCLVIQCCVLQTFYMITL